MGNQLKWVTVALVFVALTAIAVSIGSSVKSKNTSRQIGSLKGQIEQLSKTKGSLESDLIRLKSRYEQESSAVNVLKEALVQEQEKNHALAGQLQQQDVQRQQRQVLTQQRMTEDVKSSVSSSEPVADAEEKQYTKKAGTQNFTAGKSQ